MQNNNTEKKSAFEARMTYVEGASELSASLYNVIIGAMLVWGFAINYLICKFATPTILSAVYSSAQPQVILLIGIVVYFVLVMTGSRMVRSSSVAVSFIGYNLIVLPIGVLLTIAVAGYDPYIVTRAAMLTACITMLIMMAAAIKPDLFLRMGPALVVSLFAVIIVEAFSLLFFRISSSFIDYIVVAIMGLFVGFDWARAGVIQRTPTNAITVAASLYLDIINIFIRILSILGKRRD